MKHLYLILIILFSNFSYSQEDKIAQAQQNAISSMSLVNALASRIPGAKKLLTEWEIKILLSEAGSLLKQPEMK